LGNIYQSKGKHVGRMLRKNGDLNEIPSEAIDVLNQAVSYYK
jgi:hypothetical protein